MEEDFEAVAYVDKTPASIALSSAYKEHQKQTYKTIQRNPQAKKRLLFSIQLVM